jgi:hypothetical protein
MKFNLRVYSNEVSPDKNSSFFLRSSSTRFCNIDNCYCLATSCSGVNLISVRGVPFTVPSIVSDAFL